jgi:hypothetical protein
VLDSPRFRAVQTQLLRLLSAHDALVA